VLVTLLTFLSLAASGSAQAAREDDRAAPGRIKWRDSIALGTHEAGSLRRGVRLPREGKNFFTWDPIHRSSPDRPWRRWGSDDLVRSTLRVIRSYADENPQAPRVGIGDLSVRGGGDFGAEISGGIGHASHQNGLDIDVYYPLKSRKERAPLSVSEVDVRLAQDLVDRFVQAGAIKVFVGPNLPLTGPGDIVVPAANHDNHLHARFAG
jgi:murein endopeptidase